ncbi:hypothetical protein INT45_005550 [Circinella minor]|uniref:Uncharacterized protein n=1 Tax=Circinella minor TaxID=1195481 RepID=A0A8H7VJM8_9FUNG|nr:hypothetical protein INT45_005550 [Circinella minor]
MNGKKTSNLINVRIQPFIKRHCWVCSGTLTSIESDVSGDKRPDGALTKPNQLSYDPSLDFSEAKVAHSTTSNNDLWHDLLRLGIFCMFSFSYHGFTIVFYLMRLRHNGIYTMYEIAKVLFPRSLEELSSFISLKKFRSLAQISESFWRLCKFIPASEIDVMINNNSRSTYISKFLQSH